MFGFGRARNKGIPFLVRTNLTAAPGWEFAVYSGLLRHLGHNWFADGLEGRSDVELPDRCWSGTPGIDYPPAVIPVFVDSGMEAWVGLFIDVFNPRRHSYVEYWWGAWQCVEVARTLKQYASTRIYSSSHHEFAAICGLDRSEMEQIIEINDDDDRGGDKHWLLALPWMSNPAALEMVEERFDLITKDPASLRSYDGGFAHQFSQPSSLRLTPSIARGRLLKNYQHFPRQFNPQMVGSLFDEAMRAGDAALAWTALNSNGWSKHGARKAAKRLLKIADNDLMRELLRIWLSFKPRRIYDSGW